MVRALSLHIGVNEVDASTYGSVPKLRSAVKDAEDMKKIAEDLQYEQSTLLVNSEATARNVLEHLGRMAQEIQPGGVAFVTYAGHGSEVPDTTGDETSGKDQTWALYDRMLIDDELFAMWKRFAPGVTVYFVSDSCHSGSAARFFDVETAVRKNRPQFVLNTRDFGDVSDIVDRCLPPDAALLAYQKYEEQITATQWTCGTRDFSDLTATVISFGACQDEETSGDGTNNGIFTAALKLVWNNGKFNGTPKQLLDAISSKINIYQHPRFEWFGASNPSALQQIPFTVQPVSRVAWGGGEFGGLGEGKGGFGGFEPGGFAGGDWRSLPNSTSQGIWEGGGFGDDTFQFRSRGASGEPLIRCNLEIPPALVVNITPQLFDTSIKMQIADFIAKAYRQVYAGIMVSDVPSSLPLSREIHGHVEGGVKCDSGGCSGSVSGGISW